MSNRSLRNSSEYSPQAARSSEYSLQAVFSKTRSEYSLQAVFSIALLLLTLGGSNPPRAAESAGAPPTPAVAPDFELPQAGGKAFRLADSAGSIRVLLFIRHNGHFVGEALDMLEQVVTSSAQYQAGSVYVIIFGAHIDPTELAALRQKSKLKWIFLEDPQGEVHRLYKIIAVPTIVIVDKSGRIVSRHAEYSNAFGQQFRTDLRRQLGLPALKTLEDISTATRRAERLMALGDQMVRRQIWQAALSNYQTALKSDPKLTPARWRAGFCYLRMSQTRDGVAQFQQVLKEDAKSTQALVGLAWAKALQNKATEAKVDLERLRAVASQSPEYHEAWAAVHEALGAKEEARRETQAAEELRGQNVNAPVRKPTPLPAK